MFVPLQSRFKQERVFNAHCRKAGVIKKIFEKTERKYKASTGKV